MPVFLVQSWAHDLDVEARQTGGQGGGVTSGEKRGEASRSLIRLPHSDVRVVSFSLGLTDCPRVDRDRDCGVLDICHTNRSRCANLHCSWTQGGSGQIAGDIRARSRLGTQPPPLPHSGSPTLLKLPCCGTNPPPLGRKRARDHRLGESPN